MPIPPELQAAIERAFAAKRPRSEREMEALLEGEMRRYHARPQPALGGLSPDSLHDLLEGDWRTRGPLRIAGDLTAEEAERAPFVADTRLLLEYIGAHEPLKLTAANFLPRAAVVAVASRLRIPRYPGLGDMPVGKAPKEFDFPWLELVRHTAMAASLVHVRKGLRLTKPGRTMLAAGHEGLLYAKLFETLLRRMNLEWLFHVDAHHDLQWNVAFTLHRLRRVARDWTPLGVLLERCTLTAERATSAEDRFRLREGAFEHRILASLEQFGLMERRRAPRAGPFDIDQGEYRITELFDRFLRFDLPDRETYLVT